MIRMPDPFRNSPRRANDFGLRLFAVVLITACWVAPIAARAQDAAATAHSPAPYMRVVDDETERTSRLDMAVRFFAPAGEDEAGPTIALTGAIHIADRSFYALLQSFLDAQDVVLYEGVKPRGMGDVDPAEMTNEERAEQTERAMRFIAIMLERMKQATGAYPDTIAELAEWSKETAGRRVAEWVESSETDAWGHSLVYTKENGAFSLTSYGADGDPGGEDANTDLRFADQEPLTETETGNEPGMQRRLAKALGLAFQLDAMSHESAQWRNIDMSIDEVEREVEKRGGDASILFGMLEGSSFMGGVMKFLLNMVERSPRMQEMTKITLMEAMRMVGEKGMTNMRGMPESMQGLMEVILVQRNRVVIGEIQDILKTDQFGRHDTIAVIYGGAHLEDLEKRLVNDCGYEPVGGFWITAMQVDLDEAGLTAPEVEMIRKMIDRMNPQ